MIILKLDVHLLTEERNSQDVPAGAVLGIGIGGGFLFIIADIVIVGLVIRYLRSTRVLYHPWPPHFLFTKVNHQKYYKAYMYYSKSAPFFFSQYLCVGKRIHYQMYFFLFRHTGKSKMAVESNTNQRRASIISVNYYTDVHSNNQRADRENAGTYRSYSSFND